MLLQSTDDGTLSPASRQAPSMSSSASPSPSPPPMSPGWRPGKLVGHIRNRRRRREQAQVERWQREGEWHGEEGDDDKGMDEDGFEYVERPEGEGVHDDQGDQEDGEEEGDEDVTLDEYDALRHPSSRRRPRVRVQVRASPPPGVAATTAAAAEAGGAGGGGWYLGKLTGRLLRRGLLALVGEEAAQQRRTDGAPVVARLRVRLKGVRGLKGALNPYLEVICEGTRRVVKPSHFREDGGGGGGGTGGEAALDPEWGEASMTFAVTDITTNVHVLLLDKVGDWSALARQWQSTQSSIGTDTLPPHT